MIVECKACGKVFGVVLKEKEGEVTLKKVSYLKMKCPYCGKEIEWGKKTKEWEGTINWKDEEDEENAFKEGN